MLCTADTNLGLLSDSVASFVALLSNYCDVCLFLCCHLVPWVLIFLMSSIIYSFRNRLGLLLQKHFIEVVLFMLHITVTAQFNVL